MERLGGGVWGGVVAPLASLYVAFLVMLFVYRRCGVRERTGRPRRRARWSALLRQLAATAVGGYLVFLAMTVVFSFMFADERRAIGEALTGGSSVAGIGLLALALLGWVEGLIRHDEPEPDDVTSRR